jgi:hypothetical protein
MSVSPNDWQLHSKFREVWYACEFIGLCNIVIMMYMYLTMLYPINDLNLFMLRDIRVQYDNIVVLYHLPLFHISFSQWLTMRTIPRTSDQMHPNLIFGINNIGLCNIVIMMYMYLTMLYPINDLNLNLNKSMIHFFLNYARSPSFKSVEVVENEN